MIQAEAHKYRALGERKINCAEAGFTTEGDQIIEAAHTYLSPWRDTIEDATDYAINMASSIGANAFSERQVHSRWYLFKRVYRAQVLASIYSEPSKDEWQEERLMVKVNSFKESSPKLSEQVANLRKSQAALFNMTNIVAIIASVLFLTSFFN